MTTERPTEPRTYFVDVLSSVTIKITDPTAITRCTENLNDEMQPPEEGEKGWRDWYYNFRTPEDVLKHFAYNCVVNNINDASRLDGWADLEPGAVTMSLDPWVEEIGCVGVDDG